MIVKPSILRRKLGNGVRRILTHLLHRLENDGDMKFETNGEQRFVLGLFEFLARQALDRVIIFDIGANVGDYSQLLLDKSNEYGLSHRLRIHLFEPTVACSDVLSKRFASSSQVILNRNAVSKRQEAVDIYYDQTKSGMASLYKRNLKAFAIDMDKFERVDAIRLDTYIAARNIEHIHFMKIDIEGHELAALEGLGSYLRPDFIDFVQFEYGGTNLDAHTSLMDLYNLFEAAGFVIAKVMPTGLEVRSYHPRMDNFQYANYVAVSKDIIHNL